jgi:pimeloyl-ACP methyl ester carboxylesterase
MAISMIPVGDVQLCVETFGQPGDPAILLIGGATSSMDWWEADFCQLLADGGRFVIRYDHRDTGQSTGSPLGHPAYTGEDLGTDPLRVLDGLGIAAAHLVGVSMGAGISQDLAVRFPDRVLSLTLIATTAAFERADTSPLPPPEPRIAASFEDPEPDPDWTDEDAVVDRMVEVHRTYAGSVGFDEARVREISRSVIDRTPDVAASVSNHWQVIGGGEDEEPHTMAEIRQPTLVLHGSEDPMFPLPHGEALAASIPGASLVVLEGMGHEMPPRAFWDVVVPAVLRNTGN